MLQLAEKLTKGLNNKICSKAWLGYAEVLFIGFDNHFNMMSNEEMKVYNASFEIDTNLSQWKVYKNCKLLGSGEDERECAQAGMNNLLGQQVIGWKLSPKQKRLSIEFVDGLELRIIPWLDIKSQSRVAYYLSSGDDYYLAINCNGEIKNYIKVEEVSS